MTNSMQQIAEHSLFKAILPLFLALTIGSMSWIFATITELDKSLGMMEVQQQNIQKSLESTGLKLDIMQKQVVQIRIRIAELSSPGHPGRYQITPTQGESEVKEEIEKLNK